MARRQGFDPAWLRDHLQRLLPAAIAQRYCVAFSGGLDSSVLLAALVAARRARGSGKGFAVRAVHVNHGLHPRAADWSAHCARFAARLRVPLQTTVVNVSRGPGLSLEAEARAARYAALGAALRSGEVLLTAQHLDDQLETVLLQLLRGAGVAGLAAMPALAAFSRGRIARPLLEQPRAALQTWALAAGVQWIEDDSNANLAHDRNLLRQRIVPLLRERWPQAARTVTRSARHAAEAQVLLEQLARLDERDARDGSGLLVTHLRRLELPRRRNLLRYWIARQVRNVPDARRLEEIAGALLEARRDAQPQVSWGEHVLRREQGRLLIATARTLQTPAPMLWHTRRSRLDLPPGYGSLQLERDPHGTLDLDKLPGQIEVRWRGAQEGAVVKRILQRARVPASTRQSLPLLFEAAAATRLLAAGDCWLHPALRAAPDAARRAQLRWLAPYDPVAV